MKQLKTLRMRFALWTAGLLLVAFVFFGLFIYANMARRLTSEVDETLRPIVIPLTSDIELKAGRLVVIENPIRDSEYTRLREQGFSMRILNLAGQPVEVYGPYQDFPNHKLMRPLPINQSSLSPIPTRVAKDRCASIQHLLFTRTDL